MADQPGAELILDTEGDRRVMSPSREYEVGRDPYSDIVLTDPRVSWHHAVLHIREGHWTVDDVGSTNGIFDAGGQRSDCRNGTGSPVRPRGAGHRWPRRCRDPDPASRSAAAAPAWQPPAHRRTKAPPPVVAGTSPSAAAVTNHGFSNGQATTFQSVLQAGTAVLVDDHGVPRARCSCGNPLLPPSVQSSEAFSGSQWQTFRPQNVVVVQPAPVVVTVIVLFDPDTGQYFSCPAGSSGHGDQKMPPPTSSSSAPSTPPTSPSPSSGSTSSSSSSGTSTSPSSISATSPTSSGTSTPSPTATLPSTPASTPAKPAPTGAGPAGP